MKRKINTRYLLHNTPKAGKRWSTVPSINLSISQRQVDSFILSLLYHQVEKIPILLPPTQTWSSFQQFVTLLAHESWLAQLCMIQERFPVLHWITFLDKQSRATHPQPTLRLNIHNGKNCLIEDCITNILACLSVCCHLSKNVIHCFWCFRIILPEYPQQTQNLNLDITQKSLN